MTENDETLSNDQLTVLLIFTCAILKKHFLKKSSLKTRDAEMKSFQKWKLLLINCKSHSSIKCIEKTMKNWIFLSLIWILHPMNNYYAIYEKVTHAKDEPFLQIIQEQKDLQ